MRPFLLVASSVLMLGCQARSLPPSGMTSGELQPPDSSVRVQAEPALPPPSLVTDSVLQKTAISPPQSAPRLIKNAELLILVSSISETLPKVNQLLSQHQGDMLSLQETRLSDTSSTATLILRVPQQHLETLIEKLLTLGQVEQRSLTTQDVSEQLIDLEARLRNLRRTEDSLLAILNRSGTITEVLAVTQELSNIRQQIEQLTAQLTRLENQVTYSRITLTLIEERPPVIIDPNLWEQLGMTFAEALTSLSNLGISGLKALIWLLVYSPLVVVPFLLLKKWWHR